MFLIASNDTFFGVAKQTRTWYEFVNTYIEDREKLYFFKEFNFSNDGFVMTLTEAQSYVDEKMVDVKNAASKGWKGNADFAEENAKYIQDQINKIQESYS